MSVRAALEDLGEQLYAERDAAREECIRLRADKQALLQGHEEQRSEISRLTARVTELEAKAERERLAQLACDAESSCFDLKLNHLQDEAGRLSAELEHTKGALHILSQSAAATVIDRDRLRAEVEALRECWNCLRSLSRHVERMREAGLVQCDDIGPEDWARELLAAQAQAKGE